MSAYDNTVPVNEVAFAESNNLFQMEYETSVNLFKNYCQYDVFTGKSKEYDFQQKVNYGTVVAGNSIKRQRPQVRSVFLRPTPSAARLPSDIFTQATLKQNEMTNFTNLQQEGLQRDLNQIVFNAVQKSIDNSQLPTNHVIGSTGTPVDFNVELLLNIGRILASEGTKGSVAIITSAQLAVLMNDDRFVNGFYNTAKPLPMGLLMQTPAVGMELLVIPDYPSQSQFVDNGILPSFSGGNQVFAMAKDAIRSGCNITPRLKTWYDDETLTWLVDGWHSSDAVVAQPNGLIVVNASDTVTP